MSNVSYLNPVSGRIKNECQQDINCIKRRQSDNPLITVITVVFNGEQFLEETIQSVINQTYTNIEYIIIDGGSSDGTMEIIEKYIDKIDYWVSEQDKGIYDAMNKGIAQATGEWINFMNEGDWFFSEGVLLSVFKDRNHSNAQIIYGDHEVHYHSGRKRIKKAGRVENLWKGSQFCHQAVFVNTHYHKAHNFNMHNRIAADFEFFYMAWKDNIKFSQVGEVVASFAAGGVSDVNRVATTLGFWGVVEENTAVNLFYIMCLLKEILKSLIKKVIK